MNKAILPECASTLFDGIDGKIIYPNGNIKMDIDVSKETLTVKLKKSVSDVTEVYLVAYDKKERDILSYQELDAKSVNEFEIKLSNGFTDKINALVDFKYARLCVAIKWQEEYGFFYLVDSSVDGEKKNNRLDNYVHVLKDDDQRGKFIAYFSQAGLLSVKYISHKEYFNKYCKCVIKELKQSGDILKLKLESAMVSRIEKPIELISFSNYKSIDNLSVNIKNREIDTFGKEIIECEIRFNDLNDKYYLRYNVGNDNIDITFESDCKALTDGSLKDIYDINKSATEKFNVAYSIDGHKRLNINIAKNIYPYMFSIVMAVYNTEQFLGEALDSLVEQKIDSLREFVICNVGRNYKKQVFRNVYEVIMVDDGATDSSGAICDEYAAKYANFKVIHKENGGVSSARNRGILDATGKYLNFMDSDDKFSDNVLEECFKFFEDNYEETDIITFPPKLFDGSSGDHWLNEKFKKGKRIIDLMNEYDKNVLLVNASFFKAEKIKNKIKFEEKLKIGEDIRFIYTMYLNGNSRFGVIDSCTYWYRKRTVGEKSAIQAAKSAPNYYLEYLTDCIDWLISESKKTYGFLPKHIQYVIVQQLQWRFIEDTDAKLAKEAIGEDGFNAYVQHMKEQLKAIDADIILEQKKVFREQKKYMLELITGTPTNKYYDGKDVSYYHGSTKLATASTNYVRLEFLKFDGNSIYIEGYNMSFEKDSSTYLKINDEFVPVEVYNRDMDQYSLGEKIFYATAFIYRAELDRNVEDYNIKFYEKIDGHYIEKKDIRYAKTMPFSTRFSESYYVDSEWGAKIQNNGIVVKNLQDMSTAIEFYAKSESAFINQLSRRCKSDVEKEAIEFRKELVPFLANYKKEKPIWLISDRVNLAGDNGEAFFRYVMDKNDPDIDVYFVINRDSKDYEDMCKVGKVVIQNSKQHKMLHFMADYIISSQANEYIINPFIHEGTTDIFRDMLYKPKFVFLQHGVTKDDLSGWLNRYNKDMTGLVTAAHPEYQSILDYYYFYTPKEVWLTGFPRHDRLYYDEKKYITIMPTWRKYLAVSSAEDPEVNTVIDGFKDSEYFKFYNELINDKRLISAAAKNGYTICFMPHPNIMNNLDMFDHNPAVKFFGIEKPYREIYAESNLVMTDYSSSVMDFAYLRKPMVYCQFDHEDFFAGDHVYVKGYFDYERDGFGEVTYDLESLVDAMINYMDNECKLKDTYKERMDKFFAYSDRNNCERLYNRIKEDN